MAFLPVQTAVPVPGCVRGAGPQTVAVHCFERPWEVHEEAMVVLQTLIVSLVRLLPRNVSLTLLLPPLIMATAIQVAWVAGLAETRAALHLPVKQGQPWSEPWEKGARRYSAAEKGKGCHSNSQRGSTPRRRDPWRTLGLVPLIELPVHLSDRRHATAVQPSQVQLKAKYNQRNRWVGPQSHRFGAPLEHLGLGARARGRATLGPPLLPAAPHTRAAVAPRAPDAKCPRR